MEGNSGRADVFGRPAREMRSQTGYLTQVFSLYSDLTIAENIRYSGDLRRIPRNEIAERGRRYLQMFDMDRFADRLAGRLSGGMRQNWRSFVRSFRNPECCCLMSQLWVSTLYPVENFGMYLLIWRRRV